MNNRSRNSAAAATAAEQKQRLQRERERARDTQPTVRTKMWKQTKNISHEHSAIGGALSSAKNSNKRNSNNNNRNRTRIRSVTWRVKRATARAAQQRRPRLCRFEPETSRHCNTQTPHTHTHTLAYRCTLVLCALFGVQCKRRSVDVARLNGIFMMVANKSGRERESGTQESHKPSWVERRGRSRSHRQSQVRS